MNTSGADNTAVVDIVVKIGGGLLAHAGHFDAAIAAIGTAGRDRRLLVVPGGGPFADAVREVDRRVGLSDDAAHWMAVLAMDQYAHLIAARLAGSLLVTRRHEIAAEISRSVRQIPVLAPYQWLHEVDPLPHSWDVTSDSIAAWIAGQVGAEHLVLVKPPGASAGDRVDRYFARALPPRVKTVIVAVNQLDALDSALRGDAG